MLKATAHLPPNHGKGKPFAQLVLTSGERRLRRKVLNIKGEEVLVDFPETVMIAHFGGLLLEDGRVIEIVAGPEPLLEILPKGGEHLAQIAWHVGNRHMPAQIEKKRLLVPRDHMAKALLQGLGAEVREVTEPFLPMPGAYDSPH